MTELLQEPHSGDVIFCHFWWVG
ncbi:predicted protein [Streptomyces iranensis]|uniref:Uncharacterized protein n=1 Tax=Streptomyces iranensis TaxID=576784 RepID=A0A061A262_9ACTN|nr:predicted protein [Streptomyces iranensis]